jgi:hypothetical protein
MYHKLRRVKRVVEISGFETQIYEYQVMLISLKIHRFACNFALPFTTTIISRTIFTTLCQHTIITAKRAATILNIFNLCLLQN